MDGSLSLQGASALVTGGARGIGAAFVRQLHDAGARVVCGDVLAAEARALAEELGPGVVACELDVRDEAAWAAAVALAEREHGPVTALVNNAGVMDVTPLEELRLERWDEVLAINLTGTFLGMRAVVPGMRAAGGGAIVNVSSMGAFSSFAPGAPYTASKWAVRGLTKSVALELSGTGIRVNSVHPGMVRTPMTEGIPEEAFHDTIPLQRFARPEEVARMGLFVLAGATCSTGSEFAVDGGILAGVRTVG